MKRGTIEHPKMIMLASQLSCPKYAAVGLLECLWHFTSRYAPQGNVGKFSDQVIADSLGWKDDPKKLISALIACNFLEIEKTHRLIVHDWSHHADDAVNKFLKRRKLRFVDGLKPFAKVTTKARPRHDKGTPEECPIYDQPVPLPLPTPEPTPTPKNQKNKTIVEPCSTDWSYLAGMIDGEGTVRINKFDNSFTARLEIYNTDKACLEKIVENVGFGSVSESRGETDTTKSLYRISFNKEAIQKIIDQAGHLIKIKKERIELLKEFFKVWPGNRDEAERIYQKIKELNQGLEARPDEPDHIQDIFAYWQSELNHPQSRLDKKRRAAIKARLDEGYTSERIKQAIRGIKNCPHNMGQNDRATIYDDIELICRSGKNVDRFADAETAKPRFTGQERYENALLTRGAG